MTTPISADVIVYGATPGGMAAAVAAKRNGLSVAVVGGWREKRVGGMMSGGLGQTDLYNDAAVGGLSREYFDHLDTYYGRATGSYNFEPKAARLVFEEWIAEENIPVYWSRGVCGARKDGARLERFITRDGRVCDASVFIDASYEGDLIAYAGIGYRTDREPSSLYGESWAGWVALNDYTSHNFYDTGAYQPISAYRTDGVPGSGLLPRVRQMTIPAAGTGDDMVQAYNFRMTMTIRVTNRHPLPTTPPDGYDPANWELLGRWLAYLTSVGTTINQTTVFTTGGSLGGGKADYNAKGPLSTDPFGTQWDYGDAGFRQTGHVNYDLRERIWKETQNHCLGMLWWIRESGDPRIPSSLRSPMRAIRFPLDEFTDPWPGDPPGFPAYLYVREARRMVGDYVMTQADVLRPDAEASSYANEVIALASYAADSHHVVTYVDADGYARNQGGLVVRPPGDEIFNIPYSVLRPKQAECDNLLTPWSVSSSHVAFGAIRMEPTSLCLGHACGVAAAIALDPPTQVAVQQIDVADLRSQLLAENAVLAAP